jgi:hypothetical protein
MDLIEKKFIDFIQTTDEDIENVNYCNNLASEILQIIQIQHHGTTFKNKKYTNENKLHHDMAKYYVQAFQVYYAIQKIKHLQIFTEIEYPLQYPLENPLHDLYVVYNYIFHLQNTQDSYIKLNNIESSLFNKNTFLPSLEEMNSIVIQTKKCIHDLNIRQLFNISELYVEKKKIKELKKKLYIV